MLKSINKQKRRASLAVHRATKKATAAALLLALTAGVSFAQSLPAAQANRTAQSESQADVATLLTLQRAIALALDGNPDLTVAKREIEATEGQVLQGQARPNPELAYLLEDQRAQTRTQSVQINLPVEMGGKRAARIAAAERGRDIAVEDLNVRRIEIRAAVVAAFFETLAAQERVALALDSVDLARKATDAVAKRVAAGKVSPVDQRPGWLRPGCALNSPRRKASSATLGDVLPACWVPIHLASPSSRAMLKRSRSFQA